MYCSYTVYFLIIYVQCKQKLYLSFYGPCKIFNRIFYIIFDWNLGNLFQSKNILVMLMSIELMLLSVNLNFLFFSVALDDILGQVFALFALTVAAAESAIGLALLVVYYRVRGTVAVEFINLIKG